MKRKLMLMVLLICVISTGCMNKNDVQLFETKEEAISNFIEEEEAIHKGSIIEIDLNDHEAVLLFKQMNTAYYLGVTTEVNNQYTTNRLSPGVDIGNTTGAMWEFKTDNENEYTIKITKQKEDVDSIFNKDLGVFITIVKGKRRYEDQNVKNFITSKGIRSIQ
ncbi:hypothetical protein [Paenibacillus aquistagni]|uniref:Lipoprotein n=1 Tax=Paenibacillus aquistagni TaxID=1852522 RepID=A0A1X7K2J4_9BACL|nr:hypothetical protein [Paenibacillus aquistagni]SMG35015.1 hypothetical protein SAMN06295960_1988 [Paenibacillus aquistagni]